MSAVVGEWVCSFHPAISTKRRRDHGTIWDGMGWDVMCWELVSWGKVSWGKVRTNHGCLSGFALWVLGSGSSSFCF